jgi:ribosome maturation factor RimP
VEPSVAESGAEIYDLEMVGRVLKLTLDRPGGVDMEVIGAVTRKVSRLLDEADPIAGEYTLEVSSPGLERTLRTPAHFARAVGDTITVKTRPGVEGDRRIKGSLVSADESGFEVRPESGPTRRLAYDEVERVRTLFEWGPAPKPGKAKKPAAKAVPQKPSPDKKAAKP